MEQIKSYIDNVGDKFWFLPAKGKCYWHRIDGPAIEYQDGTKYWYIDNKLHRLDGPAIERADGSKFWYIDRKRHRLNGPAIEYADGTKEWWIDDKRLPTDEVDTWLEENAVDLAIQEGEMAFKLRWA